LKQQADRREKKHTAEHGYVRAYQSLPATTKKTERTIETTIFHNNLTVYRTNSQYPFCFYQEAGKK